MAAKTLMSIQGQRTSITQTTAGIPFSLQNACSTLSRIKGDLSSLTDGRSAYAKEMKACTKALDDSSRLFQDCLQPILNRLSEATSRMEKEQDIASVVLGSLGGSKCPICREGGDCYTVCYPCGHGFFHDACLRLHRESDTTCPYCRQPFRPCRTFIV